VSSTSSGDASAAFEPVASPQARSLEDEADGSPGGAQSAAEPARTEPLTREAAEAEPNDAFVPVPAGYRNVAWLRPHEAVAALDSYQRACDVPIRHEGKVVGWARYYPDNSPDARKYRANVRVERASAGSARTVCWVRPREAMAVVSAANAKQDQLIRDAEGQLTGMVQYFPPTSPEAVRFRSVTRLLRVRRGEKREPERKPVPQTWDRELEANFHRAMLRTYERARDEAGYDDTKLLDMINELGGLATARRILEKPASAGFTALWRRGWADLTVEALVLQPQYQELFTEEELAIARNRLFPDD
jgi:hypothetical protein